MINSGINRVELAFLPSVLGFFISSTLISFFLTLRVEFTSLCNLLNFTDSSVSSSDCSLDWQRNKRKVNQIIAPELCSCSWGSPASPPACTLAVLQRNLGHHQICPTGSRSSTYHLKVSGVEKQVLGSRTHTLALDRHVVHFVSTTSRSPVRRTPQDSPSKAGPVIPVSLLWFGPGSHLSGPSGLAVETWSPTTSPNQNSVDLFQSSPKIKTSRAGKREEMQKAAFCVTREDLLPHLSHPSGLSQLLPRAQQARMRTAPAFLREGQGKKLTFSAIRCSPYSPASHSVLQRFKYAQPSCFPSSIQHYREEKKSLSAAVTQAKNNPFLVIKMRVSLPSQFQHSLRSFLCFICSKCKKTQRRLQRNGLPQGRPGFPGAQSPRRRRGTPWAAGATPAQTAHPGNSSLSISSNPLP